MNGFSGAERQIQLMSSMFQNMFPSINVTKVKLNTIRRCVLLNYDKVCNTRLEFFKVKPGGKNLKNAPFQETETLEFRHYTIKVVPVGASRPIKKLVVQSKVPNLGRLEDISEFLTTGGNVSESSEGEDEESKVELPQALSSKGNMASQVKHYLNVNKVRCFSFISYLVNMECDPLLIEQLIYCSCHRKLKRFLMKYSPNMTLHLTLLCNTSF
jgi:hypothetical protein